ncbi:outer membrane beta-barrel protein [Zooshikella ganghwensis]|uniref:outer membrane beta-barrel protein n=1 Tax=Zooshikella ganghwensis TaxID=202772 RepID=UPI000403E53A|nr:outer membrane beta-barrel protein [Zooshikella ganghwensis]
MKKTALFFAISSIVSTPLFAQDSINPYADEKTGFYLGLGAGAASYDDAYANEKDVYDEHSIPSTVNGYKSLKYTKRDGLVKIFGGYRINKYFALEANYTKFADTESDLDINWLNIGRNTRSVDNEISGYGLKAVGIYPVSKNIELNASFGLMKWQIEEDITETDTIFGTTHTSEKVKGTSKVFGLGASYNLTNNVAFGLDWERINDLGDKDKLAFGETDVDTFTLSAKYTF